MRRPWWERGFSALFALWFALTLAEPAALHTCPVHGGGLAVATSGGGTAAADAHQAHGQPQGSDQQGGHHSCTCLGDCNMGGAAAGLPSTSVRLTTVATRPFAVAPIPTTRTVVSVEPHALPFANGPPLA